MNYTIKGRWFLKGVNVGVLTTSGVLKNETDGISLNWGIVGGLDSSKFVFPISANCLRLAWERCRDKSHIKGLRFHDLRHEAVSRFFEMGLSVPEVALISGHKDVRQLFRYTHLKPENLIAKYSSIFKEGN